MKEKISVIVPTYNVEEYISKCLDSIINQTYKNYEIICIDDCSSDNTYKILKEYEKKYNNIKVIKNEKNSGAGYSRNKALEIATGKYVSFIDSDDYIENNFLEELIKSIKSNDLAVCDIYIRYDNKEMTDNLSIACLDESNKLTFINNGLAASPCNKLFKKDILLKYPFPEGIMNEDIAVVLPILINSKKIGYTNKTYYNYVQHKRSVQNSKLSDKRLDIFKSINILKNRVELNNEYLDAIIYNQLILFLIYVVPKCENKEMRLEFLKKFYKLSKEYNVYNNVFYQEFLSLQGKKHRIFYSLYIKFFSKNKCGLANLMITLYQCLLKRRKPVIKENITIEDLKELAKQQQLLSDNNIKLSVVIPNYNYSEFLHQRIYSILNQKEKIYEIILLDDYSTDNSRSIIDKMVNELSNYISIRSIYNDKNSGSAFKQWEKGFNEAKGNYVWIAEADDYVDCNFLKKVLKPIKNDENIVISYCDTAFIDKKGYIIMKTIKNEIDLLKTKHWDSDFINNGIDEIKKYAYLNCTIANVSSVIFKNGNYKEYFKLSSKYKQAGDWLFYVNVMQNGKISYINKPLNYYRLHGNNVTSTTKKNNHLNEIKRIHEYLGEKYKFNSIQKENIKNRYNFLEKVWNIK